MIKVVDFVSYWSSVAIKEYARKKNLEEKAPKMLWHHKIGWFNHSIWLLEICWMFIMFTMYSACVLTYRNTEFNPIFFDPILSRPVFSLMLNFCISISGGLIFVNQGQFVRIYFPYGCSLTGKIILVYIFANGFEMKCMHSSENLKLCKIKFIST